MPQELSCRRFCEPPLPYAVSEISWKSCFCRCELSDRHHTVPIGRVRSRRIEISCTDSLDVSAPSPHSLPRVTPIPPSGRRLFLSPSLSTLLPFPSLSGPRPCHLLPLPSRPRPPPPPDLCCSGSFLRRSHPVRPPRMLHSASSLRLGPKAAMQRIHLYLRYLVRYLSSSATTAEPPRGEEGEALVDGGWPSPWLCLCGRTPSDMRHHCLPPP